MTHCWTRLIYPYIHRKPVLEYSGAEAANASCVMADKLWQILWACLNKLFSFSVRCQSQWWETALVMIKHTNHFITATPNISITWHYWQIGQYMVLQVNHIGCSVSLANPSRDCKGLFASSSTSQQAAAAGDVMMLACARTHIWFLSPPC